MIKRIFIPILLFVLGPGAMIQGPAFASEYNIGTKIMGEVKKNTQNRQLFPVNGYISGSAYGSKTAVETNMRFFRDFDAKLDQYDLYQTVMHAVPFEKLQIDGGRQFINQGFSVEILDGLQATAKPTEYLAITAFSGIPRNTEVQNFSPNTVLLTGLSLGLRDIKKTDAALHVAWRKNNVENTDFNKNDEIQVGAVLSHQFPVSMTPFVYGLIEADATGRMISQATTGLDIYPHSRLALNAEFNYFNVNQGLDRQTIQELYTKGRTLEGRFSATWTILPQYLKLVENYYYDNIEVLPGDLRNNQRLDAGLEMIFDNIGLQFNPGYYFIKSFGGRLNGARVLIHEQFNDLFYAELSVDYTTYKKITNDNDDAVSLYGWSGYEIVKGLVLSGGFEYNKNNLFDRDVRGSFRLDYLFDHKS